MKIAIIDDDARIREEMSAYVERYNASHESIASSSSSSSLTAVTFTTGDDFCDTYTRGAFDAIFLDIEMPGSNGMDVARHIRTIDEHVILIFVTNLSQYALQGYEVQATDYILKPLSYFDFELKMTRILRRLIQDSQQSLAFETTEGLRSVRKTDVTFLEAKNHYVYIHTAGDSVYKMRDSLSHQESALDGAGFLRVHKSFLVHMQHIQGIYTNELICHGITIPIGRSYKTRVQPAFLAYISGQNA